MSTAVAAAQRPSSTTSASPTVVLSQGEDDVVTEKKLASVSSKVANPIAEQPTKAEKVDVEQDPLPPDLRRILTQVAHTGTCPWLSWNGQDASFNKKAANFAPHRNAAFSFSSVRKKHRNGVVLHGNKRRFAENAGRKRPLFLNPSGAFSASSIGSGRTSGSEPEDSTQYECDSEGTSATTNSELSVERRRRVIVHTSPGISEMSMTSKYKSLREALKVALERVLDHSFRCRGGYKLSPAELRIHAAAVAAQNAEKETLNGGNDPASQVKTPSPSPEKTFQQRRRRLLSLLGDDDPESDEQESKPQTELAADNDSVPLDKGSSSSSLSKTAFPDGPPFTIQRIAEVLVDPERYYKQTHKLCNCLEKLLLITSPANAFGGSVGGDTPQSRGEETELAALSDKRGRQESEYRSRRLKRRMSSLSDDDNSNMQRTSPQHTQTKQDASGDDDSAKKQSSPEDSAILKGEQGESDKAPGSPGSPSNGSEMSSREIMEAAARASLRSKFDHVGIDPHMAAAAVDRNAHGGNRGMTSSPPPPSLAIGGAAPGMTMAPHGAVAGFARHLGEQSGDSAVDSIAHHANISRTPIPIMFSGTNENGTPVQALHANHSMNLLQLHHAAALAGVSLGGSPLDLLLDSAANGTSASASASSRAPASSELADLEVEPGRSSASNSDVDSESDDFSLDDSASDRSDGSDSGHYEPFTAARVMALNRMQQQQRMQNRTSIGSLGDGPPADSEYQSGDSIDSTMAEDSCGSDSSSSDVAD